MLPRRVLRTLILIGLVAAASWFWAAHIEAWNTGPRRPILGYDAAQYALAGRELAEHGRLTTTYAMPIELASHPQPPWPLAVVQPGLVLVEAALFKLTPDSLSVPGRGMVRLDTPERREWLVLILPCVSFIVLTIGLALATIRLVHRYGGRAELAAAVTGVVVAAGFIMDPEAQHFASGGFTEMPFTLGLFIAIAHLASGGAVRRPVLFGLLLGITGLFRANMLWLAPLFAVVAAWSASPGSDAARSRTSIAVRILIGFALPLAPWWFYKWQAFGSPAWDLSRFALWDAVGGRSWFSLAHLPRVPDVPTGAAGLSLIAGKIINNMSTLSLQMVTGPRGLWLGALVIWLVTTKDESLRSLRAAGLVIVVAMVLNMLVASAGIPWLRYLFPSRVFVDAAGILALWHLVRRLPLGTVGPAVRTAMGVAVGVIVLSWGAFQHVEGSAEARAGSITRGIPSSLTMEGMVSLIDEELAEGEPIMSNLGPTLAWYTPRPVVHLALTPADIDDCRRLYPVEHVLLAFRSADRAWRGWDQIIARPAEAPDNPDWNIRRVRQYDSSDGFIIVWLELGPLEPGLAGGGSLDLRDAIRLSSASVRR